MQKNIPTLLVLSPTFTAVESVSCKQSHSIDACKNHETDVEAFYQYFSDMMKFYKFPYIDFLQHLVDYSKEKQIKSLYANNGEDTHHYSPQGNYILPKLLPSVWQQTLT
jgi:hypothetical protein